VTIIFLLIPLGLVLVGFAVWAFFWAVGDGQFDDLESPAWSIVAEEGSPLAPATERTKDRHG
jgi:cbb3-type cytochrome oxidase maturation protein